MSITSEQVLAQLVEATREAKATVRELHEARAAGLDVLKKQRQAITDAIAAAVEENVGTLAGEARARMVAAADEIILGLERDWRAVLKLDVG